MSETRPAERDALAENGAGWRGAVRALSAHLRRPTAGGDVAALRRGRPDEAPDATFYRLMAEYIEPRVRIPPDPEACAEHERAWGAVLAAVASLATVRGASELSLGRALAEADVAEMRVLRLLRARGPSLHDLVRTSIHQIVSKGVLCDPVQLADLVLSDPTERREQVRRRIAREYYAAQQKKD